MIPQPDPIKKVERPEGTFRIIHIDSSRAFLRAASIFFLANREVIRVEQVAANHVAVPKVTQDDANFLVLEYLPEDEVWMQSVRQLRQLMPGMYILVLANEVIPFLPNSELQEVIESGANEVYSKSVLSQKFTQTLERAKNWTAAIQGKS